MAEAHYQPLHQYYNQQNPQKQPKTTQLAKVATAVTTGGSLLILSSLILAGTIIGLAIVTPLFVIFSPVLVPAVITVALLSIGLLSSGGFGVAAITMLMWFYRYGTGKHRPSADQLDTARPEIQDYGQQQISGRGAYSS